MTVTTYYNGSCPICSAEIEHYKRIALPEHGLAWCDLAAHPDALRDRSIDPVAAKKRLHAIGPDGALHSGIDAFALIWQRLPRYRWLYRLMRTPVLKPMGEALYDHLLAPALFHWNRRRGRI